MISHPNAIARDLMIAWIDSDTVVRPHLFNDATRALIRASLAEHVATPTTDDVEGFIAEVRRIMRDEYDDAEPEAREGFEVALHEDWISLNLVNVEPDLFDFYVAETGGGCTALQRDEGATFTLITEQGHAKAPNVACVIFTVGRYDAETGQPLADPLDLMGLDAVIALVKRDEPTPEPEHAGAGTLPVDEDDDPRLLDTRDALRDLLGLLDAMTAPGGEADAPEFDRNDARLARARQILGLGS